MNVPPETPEVVALTTVAHPVKDGVLAE